MQEKEIKMPKRTRESETEENGCYLEKRGRKINMIVTCENELIAEILFKALEIFIDKATKEGI